MADNMWNPNVGNEFARNEFAPNPFANTSTQPPQPQAQQQDAGGRSSRAIEWNEAALAATFEEAANIRRQSRSASDARWQSPPRYQQSAADPYRRQSTGMNDRITTRRPDYGFEESPRRASTGRPPPPPSRTRGPSIDDLAAQSLQNFSLEAHGKPLSGCRSFDSASKSSARTILPPNPYLRSPATNSETSSPVNMRGPISSMSDMASIDALRVSEEVSFSSDEAFGGGGMNSPAYYNQPPPIAANPFLSHQNNALNSPSYNTPTYPVDVNDESFMDGFSVVASNPFAPGAIQQNQSNGLQSPPTQLPPKNKGENGHAIKAAPEDVDAEAAGKRMREKKHALDELLTTECTYRDQLACFVEKLQRPLNKYCKCLENEATRLGTPAQREDAAALRRAFAPLPAEQLLEISQDLVSKLQQRQIHASDYSGCYAVGDIFESIVERMKDAMITWYDWHAEADVELRRLAPKSEETRAFVENAASDPRCGDHQITSLLIAPTQRLVRQMMFLERLAKTTTASNPDSQKIIVAYDLWRELLDACNVSAGNRAMQRRAQAIARVLDGAPDKVAITAHGRLLTHEGSLYKVGGNTLRPDYFFLFQTAKTTELLHTSMPDNSGRFGFRRFMKLLHVEDVDLTSAEDTAALAPGTVRRSSLYGLPTGRSSILSSGGLSRASSFSDAGASSQAATGGGPGANEASEGPICDLLLRLVACDLYDGSKSGYIYTLAGDRESLLAWKAKVTHTLNKSSTDYKLRYKGNVTVLAEGPCSFGLSQVRDREKDAFMWFFLGRSSGRIVRATTGTARSGKLEWKELLSVQSIDGGLIPDEAMRGEKLKKAVRQRSDHVFRIVAAGKTLIVAAEEKNLIVDLMKISQPDRSSSSRISS